MAVRTVRTVCAICTIRGLDSVDRVIAITAHELGDGFVALLEEQSFSLLPNTSVLAVRKL